MDNQTAQKQDESIQKLAQLINKAEYAMLTTVTPNGQLHSRPMVTRQMDPEGNLWFLTGGNSPKVQEIKNNTHVSLSYSNPSDREFVSVTGQAQVFKDKQKAQELWNPAYKAWFPKGLEDPELSVLKVTLDQAEFWDSPSTSAVYAIGLIKSVLKGEPYRPSKDEHQKIDKAG